MILMWTPSSMMSPGSYEPNGNTLLSPGKKWTHWQWVLPATELYTVQLNGGATTEAYTLTAKLAERIKLAMAPTPPPFTAQR